MHTSVGTKWLGIPTSLDRLFYPSISIANGGTGSEASLLIHGAPAFIVSFGNVEAICAYEETPYWSLAREENRPQHVLNMILDTPLLHEFRAFRHKPSLTHFLVCGGDMCAEIIADCYAIEEFEGSEQSAAACAGRMTGSRKRVSYSKWVAP